MMYMYITMVNGIVQYNCTAAMTIKGQCFFKRHVVAPQLYL